eukprot:908583-Prymnesium_polylepis.1
MVSVSMGACGSVHGRSPGTSRPQSGRPDSPRANSGCTPNSHSTKEPAPKALMLLFAMICGTGHYSYFAPSEIMTHPAQGGGQKRGAERSP